jgi:spore germination protein KB
MDKTLAPRQVFALLFLMLISNAMTISQSLGRDGWLSLAFALLWTLPVYALLLKTNALGCQKDWFDRMTDLLGVVGGGILFFFLATLAGLLAIFSLRNFLLLTRALALPQTSPFLLGTIVILCALPFAVRGILQAGRWAAPVFWLVLVFLLVSLVMTIPDWQPEHLYPLLAHGWRAPFKNSFPLALTIGTEGLFLLAMIDNRKNPYAPSARRALGISYLLLICVFLRNLFLLGFALSSRLLNPSYTAAGLISLGSFFQRGEVLVTIPFVLCDLLKLAVLLMFAKNSILAVFPHLSDCKLTVALGGVVLAAGCVLAQENLSLTIPQQIVRLLAVLLFVCFSLGFWIKLCIKNGKPAKANQKPKEDSL